LMGWWLVNMFLVRPSWLAVEMYFFFSPGNVCSLWLWFSYGGDMEENGNFMLYAPPLKACDQWRMLKWNRNFRKIRVVWAAVAIGNFWYWEMLWMFRLVRPSWLVVEMFFLEKRSVATCALSWVLLLNWGRYERIQVIWRCMLRP
jgi:hypothetical protein